MGGARVSDNLSVSLNNKKEKSIKNSLNVKVQDDLNLSAFVEHDTEEFKSVLANFEYKYSRVGIFGNTDFKEQLTTFGFKHECHSAIKHVFESTYGWSEDFKGI